MTTTKLTATQVQYYEPSKRIFADSGLLAKWPIIGLIMFIFGSLAFGGLTYNLFAHGPLLKWDNALANTLPAIGLKSPTFIRVLMEAGYYIGNEVIIVLLVLLGFYFIVKQYWHEFIMMAVGMAGGSALFLSLSNFFARQRPPTQIWNILHIPGFPSGHAIGVVIFYGFLAYLLAPNIQSSFWRVVVIATAILIILFVGFSRVFTGGHYLTDVLAGYAVGIAWFGMIFTLLELYFQKRRSLYVKKG